MDKRTQGPRHLPPCLPNDCTGNNIEWEDQRVKTVTIPARNAISKKSRSVSGNRALPVTSMSHRFVEKKEFRNISRTK